MPVEYVCLSTNDSSVIVTSDLRFFLFIKVSTNVSLSISSLNAHPTFKSLNSGQQQWATNALPKLTSIIFFPLFLSSSILLGIQSRSYVFGSAYLQHRSSGIFRAIIHSSHSCFLPMNIPNSAMLDFLILLAAGRK